LDNARSLLELLSYLISDLHGFKTNGFLAGADFYDLLTQATQWAHFTNDIEYRRIREEERAIVLFAAGDATQVAVEVLSKLHPWLDAGSFASKESRDLVAQIISILTTHIIEKLHKAFSEENGIGALVSSEHSLVYKWILFRRESGVYSDKGLAFLRGLSLSVDTGKIVQENFLFFLLMLAKGKAVEAVGPEEAKRLATDTEIIGIYWTGALAQRLNPRSIGTAEEIRELLKSGAGDDSHLPFPKWWDEKCGT
jgi:hypothetical protein